MTTDLDLTKLFQGKESPTLDIVYKNERFRVGRFDAITISHAPEVGTDYTFKLTLDEITKRQLHLLMGLGLLTMTDSYPLGVHTLISTTLIIAGEHKLLDCIPSSTIHKDIKKLNFIELTFTQRKLL